MCECKHKKLDLIGALQKTEYTHINIFKCLTCGGIINGDTLQVAVDEKSIKFWNNEYDKRNNKDKDSKEQIEYDYEKSPLEAHLYFQKLIKKYTKKLPEISFGILSKDELLYILPIQNKIDFLLELQYVLIKKKNS